jgi:hypothetical protein
MNKQFYSVIIFVLALSLLAGIIQSIFYLLLNGELFRLEAFAGWFILINLLSITGTIFILKYYHFRGYSLAFSAGMVATAANLVFAIIFYTVLEYRQLQQFYIAGLLLVLVTSFVYGVSLISSRANQKAWLKRTGICLVILTLLLGGLILLNVYAPNSMRPLIVQIDQWISLFGNTITFLFILHFRNEMKHVKIADNPIFENKNIVGSFDYLKMIFLTSTLVLGALITQQGMSSLSWRKKNQESTAELVKKSEAKYFVNTKGDTLKYLLMKPKDFDPQKKYPLVVCLPAGDYGAPPAELLSTDFNRRRYPAFIFVPYCPAGFGWGGNDAFIPRDTIVYDAINALDDTSIDRTWHFIITHPEMFAAAIPVCGGGDPALGPKIAGVPVWAFHGAKDKNVPVEESRKMIEGIKKAGGDPKYTEFPDKAHGIWWEVTQTPGVLEWLFEQRKE